MRAANLMEMVAENASPELFKRMQKWLQDNPIEMYWDYNDRLGEDGIDSLVAGDSFSARDEVWECITNNEYHWEMEVENVTECVREYLTELLCGFVIDEENLDDDDLQEIADGLQLRYEIIFNDDFESLVNMTDTRLTLDLGLEHEAQTEDHYDSCDYVLDFFNVNPYLMYLLINGLPSTWDLDTATNVWPDIPERNGNEYVEPLELLQAWLNFRFYSGEWMALLNGRYSLLTWAYALEETQKIGKDLYVTLSPDTQLVAHDNWNGSSSPFVTLRKEMRIKVTIKYQLARDGKFGYGVDAVYGTLGSDTWDSELKFEVVDIKEMVNEQS